MLYNNSVFLIKNFKSSSKFYFSSSASALTHFSYCLIFLIIVFCTHLNKYLFLGNFVSTNTG